MSTRPLSLAHLSLIHLSPPELVRVAADAGFSSVLIRLTLTSDGRGHDMMTDAAMRRATVDALASTGLRAWDTEVVRLKPGVDVNQFEPLLAVSAELGSKYMITTVEDDDSVRAAENFASLCALAEPYGISPNLEFMVFSKARTLPEAQAVLAAAGAANSAVLVDALHLFRSGGTVAEVAALPPGLMPYLQLCDAPDAAAATSPAVAREEASRARLVPGQGTLPLVDLLAALPADHPISVEVPSAAGPTIDAAAYARQLWLASETVMATADERRAALVAD